MNRELEHIYQQNLLIVKILWLAILLDEIVGLFYSPEIILRFLPIWVYVSAVAIFSLLVYKKVLIKETMYLLMASLFAYVFLCIHVHPYFSKLIFLYFVIVVASLYQQLSLVILSGIILILQTNYFIFVHKKIVMEQFNTTDALVINLFTLVLTIVLAFGAKLTKSVRERAEQRETIAIKELVNNKEYLESLFDNTSDAIVIADLEGIVTRVNKAYEELFGWKASKIVGKLNPSIPKELMQEKVELWQTVISGGQINGYETRRVHKDGSLVYVSITVSAIHNDAGEMVALATFIRDITERKQTEVFLQKAEKLKLVGELAAGMAHEVRNPLTTVKGFLQLSAGNTKKLEEVHDILLSEIDRIETIIGEFLILAKPQAQRRKKINAKDMLNHIILLAYTQAVISNETIELVIEDGLPKIVGDDNQLKQVFINLIKNAMEAMTDGGVVQVNAAIWPEDTTKIIISVKDEGCGMTEEQLASLGNPFFTTKSNGTGLGLMISYKIVADHQGLIKVQSKEGKGTTFSVILPIDQPSNN